MLFFGNAMLWGGLLTALLALAGYVAHVRGKQDGRDLARASFAVSAVAILAASVVLMLAFLQGRYDMEYVASYSSSNLPLMYKVSAFWAGQEGSFLLWALLGGIMGLAIIRKAGKWEGPVMSFFTGIQSFLLLLLVVRSPFRPSEQFMMDGRGLNPLLQDPWMAIHPPMIFLGYAALAVPFAFALAALVRRDYDRWVVRALPWTLFAWVTLGAGIFIGGYWAYRVLGWGGYWGWDPVENSSLIPWLLTTALLHGMLMQRARGALKRGNLLLSFATFATVLYGTFLTRSGVLKDFSVHSFESPGMTLYWILLLGVVTSLIGPGAFFIRRSGEIKSAPTYDRLLSRDFAFWLGALVLCISAAVVIFGTSAPIFTSLMVSAHLMKAPISPEAHFYNVMHYPVAVLLGLLVAVAPIVAWNQDTAGAVARRMGAHLVVALVGMGVALAAGVHNVLMLILVGASVLCLSVNFALLAGRLAKGAPLRAGGVLSHVGLALMLIGIVSSAVYSRSKQLTLQPGQSGDALGYKVTYVGVDRPDDAHRNIRMKVERGGRTFDAGPHMLMNEQMGEWMKNPGIVRFWNEDLYLSPMDLREQDVPQPTSEPEPGAAAGDLGKGESMKAGGYTFTFKSFDMSAHQESGGSGAVGAVIEVTRPNGSKVTVTPVTGVDQATGQLMPKPAQVPGTGLTLSFTMSVPRIQLSVAGLPKQGAPAPKPAAAPVKPAGPDSEVVIEVSNKPLINLLWLGTVLVLAGGLLAGTRRARESAKDEREEEEQASAAAATARNNSKRPAKERKPVGSQRG